MFGVFNQQRRLLLLKKNKREYKNMLWTSFERGKRAEKRTAFYWFSILNYFKILSLRGTINNSNYKLITICT